MVERQQAFFFKKRTQKTSQAKQSSTRWADIFQALISNGHDKAALQRYTQRQLELFYASILRQNNHAKADLIEAVNQGFGGGPELSKYLKTLRGK